MANKNLYKHIESIQKLPKDKQDAAITTAINALEAVRPIEHIDPEDIIAPMHFRPAHNRTLIFRGGNDDTALILIDFISGDVALAEHLTATDAAKVFWDAVRQYDDG